MLKKISNLGKTLNKNEQRQVHGGGGGLAGICNRTLASCLNFCTAPNTQCCPCSEPENPSLTHTCTFVGF